MRKIKEISWEEACELAELGVDLLMRVRTNHGWGSTLSDKWESISTMQVTDHHIRRWQAQGDLYGVEEASDERQ